MLDLISFEEVFSDGGDRQGVDVPAEHDLVRGHPATNKTAD